VDAFDAADEALLEALGSGEQDDASLTRGELAERTGLPVVVLEALEREGFLVPEGTDVEVRYSARDVDAVVAGARLLEAGLPLAEVLHLARRLDGALRGVADDAVELFARFVRDPIHAQASSGEEAADRLLGAFAQMLDATEQLVAHHVRRVLLEAARTRAADASGPR
jgi:DNA-binding transcriptional MerR regulator